MKHRRQFGMFKLTIPGTKYWYLVHVYPDRKAMHAAYRTKGGSLARRRELRFYARCDTQACDVRRFNRPCKDHGWFAGEMFFASPYAGAGLVAHEMTHAAVAHLDCCGVRNFRTAKNDERLAALTGKLVSAFWRKWWKLPLTSRRVRQRRDDD